MHNANAGQSESVKALEYLTGTCLLSYL